MTLRALIITLGLLVASLVGIWLHNRLRPLLLGAWYIVTPTGTMGPFFSYSAALSYESSFRGWVDSPVFRNGYTVEHRPGVWGNA